MIISFIIPFYNEQDFLYKTLLSIDKQIINGFNAEVFLVDGISTDNSRSIIEEFVNNKVNEYIDYVVLENINKKVPFAFNLGIEKAAGEIIGLGGAHTIYPPDYFQNVINILNEIDTDVVGGGHDEFIPGNKSLISKAMTALYISPLGAGVAPYHRRNNSGFVDTVYGGFYKRDIFKMLGSFNTSLHRMQDYEFNVRVRKAGYKIYFDPRLHTKYIQRTNLQSLVKRGYKTGFHLPEAWIKDQSTFKIRHVTPFIFVLYNLFLLFNKFYLGFPQISYLLFYFYLMLLFLSSLWLGISRSYGFSSLFTIPIFYIYHLSYGIGTLFGLLKASIKSILFKK